MEGNDTKSLSENIFGKKVRLAAAMQESTFAEECYQEWRKELVTECNAQVLALNTELVSVRLRREYVEKYRKLGSFTYISEGAKGELIDHIAPLVYMNDPDEYAKRFDNGPGWVSAGSGRIDLTGKPLAELTYTKVAFGLEKIGIGVVPVHYAHEAHSPSAWKMSNAIESWSFEGCEGKKTSVEVYARAHHVSLYVNGECVGTKNIKKDCKTNFHVAYHSGELKAVSYDENNCKIAEKILKTADAETRLTLAPEQEIVREDDLVYIRMKYTDFEGEWKPMIRGSIRVTVEGGKILGIGSACPYYERSYHGDTADTYYGEAMVIVKPDTAKELFVKAESPYGSAVAKVLVMKNKEATAYIEEVCHA